jgi:putative transposase
MPRQTRQFYQGQYYHIITRGNNRQFLFREAEDFEFYMEQVRRYKERYEVAIVHYCIMSNHVHFLMRNESGERGISKMMQGLGMAYARYYKKKRRKTGHVFEDRFKSIWIETDAYLLECGRYIERNPVRAKMVKKADEYKWSSYRYYAYGEPDALITENILYQGLGQTPEECREAYCGYVGTPRAYESIIDKYFNERVLI